LTVSKAVVQDKDSLEKDECFKSVRRASNLKLEENDCVVPFNPNMFSPRDQGDKTGRGAANQPPEVSVRLGSNRRDSQFKTHQDNLPPNTQL
jgi:hypothetical protein